MRIIAIAAALAVSLPALADPRIPAGTWVCETDGLCVDPTSLQQHGTTVEGTALFPYRGLNHRASLVRDCMSTRATVRGVPDLAENMPIIVGHQWMCQKE